MLKKWFWNWYAEIYGIESEYGFEYTSQHGTSPGFFMRLKFKWYAIKEVLLGE